MKKFFTLPFIRDFDSTPLVELFLLNAVGAIIVIRVFLTLTGFPQIGGGGLHIAHMLWGGLLMLIAIGLSIIFLGKSIHAVIAIVGGIGFGLFIDELGKFITSDNDYFFQPTFAIMYVIFVVIFIVFHWFSSRGKKGEDEYLANALAILTDSARIGLDDASQAKITQYLKNAGITDETAAEIVGALPHTEASSALSVSTYTKVKRWLSHQYNRLLSTRWFHWLIAGLFILRGLSALFLVLLFVLLVGVELTDPQALQGTDVPETDFFAWGSFIAAVVMNILVLIGLFAFPRSRLRAYIWFRRSVVISIFFYQFFAFYHDQWLAVIGLIIDFLLLYGLTFFISQEEKTVPEETAEN